MRTAPASRLPPARDSVAQVGEYRIHSREFGAGGDAVVLIHGLSGSSRWWDRNIGPLARRFRVVVPDIIGFGRTRGPWRQPSIHEVARVLADWMITIGLERAHLVGHSMGGQISIHLAAQFPARVSRLVLVDSAGIPRLLGPLALARFALGVAPPRAWGDPLFLPVIVGDAFSAGPRTILQATAHILRDDVRPLLAQIRAPTMILWGERDSVIPLEHAEQLQQGIAGAELVVLRDAAHNPMVDRPSRFNRAVIRFLCGEQEAD